ncbi:2626_t:CDS:1 [Funneliformis geosporum]|uniref:13752_t:CDS:1 n=1 Tax=Funneliformis geosporum TaxID=1117311 RepID=A0A9W4T0C2_9GLOM|nr:13752_t:CDS:1 [Funneliformis geosporum]CAI2188519.1 2626_t:CDS:1 [Funneliformis geosporum]
METFYHLFLRQGKKLKSLEILTELLDQSLFNTEFIDTIILNNLVNVKTLTIRKRQHFDIPLFVHFLKKLSNDYNEIKFFNHKYETFNFSPLIKNLILKQRQLTKFKINSESYFSKINTRTKLQFDNLVSLTLINMNLLMISFDNFNNFNNLKELIFNNCEEMSDIQRNKLTKAPYNLKTLGLGKWSARTIELLIKTFGSSLKKLLVGTITIEIINIVSLYCSELVTFKILDNITSIHFPSFPILKKIKIKKLTFLFCDSSLIEPSIFLKNIAIHFPESISNLCLFYNEILSADKLETILYNTKPSLTSLTINCEIDNNCLQVILDYVKIRKSTKILKLKIQVNISKLDLLARNVLKNLREQGVDVQLLII